MTIDCYADSLKQIESTNSSWSPSLRGSNLANDQDTRYVYINEVLLHDENLNVVARASLGQAVMKRTGDKLLFKLPLTY